MPIGNNLILDGYGFRKINTLNSKNVSSVNLEFTDVFSGSSSYGGVKSNKEGSIILGTFYLYTDSQRIEIQFGDSTATGNFGGNAQNTGLNYKTSTSSTNSGNYSDSNYLGFSPMWWSNGNDTSMAGSTHTNNDDSVARTNLIMFINGGYTGDTEGFVTSPAVFSGGYGMTNFVSNGGYTHYSTFSFTLRDDYPSTTTGMDSYDQITNKIKFFSSSGNIDAHIDVYAFTASGGAWE